MAIDRKLADIALTFFAALLLTVAAPNGASATPDAATPTEIAQGAPGLKDQIAAKAAEGALTAAQQTAIEALLNVVQGLGERGVANLGVADGVVEAGIRILNRDFNLWLFSPSFAGDFLIVLKPASDLKISDIVAGAPGIEVLDAITLQNQVFLFASGGFLFNSGDLPAPIRNAVRPAFNNAGNFIFDVADGLTVLGRADLSKSSAVNAALNYLKVPSGAKQLTLRATLPRAVLAEMLAGRKPDPSIVVSGLTSSFQAELPGGGKLPESRAGFAAAISKNLKLVTFNVTTDGEWRDAFGFQGLTLKDPAVGITIGAPLIVSVDATARIGGKDMSVSWLAAADGGGKMPEIILNVAPAKAGDTFRMSGISVFGSIPGLSDLQFKSISVSTGAIGADVVFGGKSTSAAFALVGSQRRPVFLVRTLDFAFKDLPGGDTISEPIKSLKMPKVVIGFSANPLNNVDAAGMPGIARQIMGDVADTTGGRLNFTDGVTLFAQFDPKTLGGNADTLNLPNQSVYLAGAIGGYTDRKPEVQVAAALPGYQMPKNVPKFLTPIGSVQPRLFLRARRTATGPQAQVGVGMQMELDAGSKLVLGIDMSAAGGGTEQSLNLTGTAVVWENAFGVKDFDIHNASILIGAGSTGGSFGLRGDFRARNTTFAVESGITFSPAAGFPSEVILSTSANRISLEGLMDLSGVFLGERNLYQKLKLNVLPEMEIVEFTDKGNVKKSAGIYMATPGASLPNLELTGPAVGVHGQLRVEGADISLTDMSITATGIKLFGEVQWRGVSPYLTLAGSGGKGGPTLDVAATPFEQHFKMDGRIGFLGLQQDGWVELSRRRIGFSLAGDYAGFGATTLAAVTEGKSLSQVKDFSVKGEITQNLVDQLAEYVIQGATEGFGALGGQYDEAQARLAEAKAESALAKSELDDARKAAEEFLANLLEPIKAAKKEVDKLRKKITKNDKRIDELKKWLEDNGWKVWKADEIIEKTAELVKKEVQKAALKVAHAVAKKALDIAERGVEVVPVEMHPAVLAKLAEYYATVWGIQAAQAVIFALDKANSAVQTAITEMAKGAQQLVKYFDIRRALFEASASALWDKTRGINMELDVVVNDKLQQLGVTFYPADPAANFAALIKLAKDAGKQIGNDIKDREYARNYREPPTPDPELGYMPKMERAAFYTAPDRVYLFRGEEYVRMNWLKGKADNGYPKPTEKFTNGFPKTIDSAFHALIGERAGKVYAFKDKQYWRMDAKDLKIDGGYPKDLGGWDKGKLWAAVRKSGLAEEKKFREKELRVAEIALEKAKRRFLLYRAIVGILSGESATAAKGAQTMMAASAVNQRQRNLMRNAAYEKVEKGRRTYYAVHRNVKLATADAAAALKSRFGGAAFQGATAQRQAQPASVQRVVGSGRRLTGNSEATESELERIRGELTRLADGFETQKQAPGSVSLLSAATKNKLLSFQQAKLFRERATILTYVPDSAEDIVVKLDHASAETELALADVKVAADEAKDAEESVKNADNEAGGHRVDAAFHNVLNNKVYMFVGAHYIRLDGNTFEVDGGYPKPIKGNWPGVWTNYLDAALEAPLTASQRGSVHAARVSNNTRTLDLIKPSINTYMFSGHQYVLYRHQNSRGDPPKAMRKLGDLPPELTDKELSEIEKEMARGRAPDAAFQTLVSNTLLQLVFKGTDLAIMQRLPVPKSTWQSVPPNSAAGRDIGEAFRPILPIDAAVADLAEPDRVHVFKGDKYYRFRIDTGDARLEADRDIRSESVWGASTSFGLWKAMEKHGAASVDAVTAQPGSRDYYLFFVKDRVLRFNVKTRRVDADGKIGSGPGIGFRGTFDGDIAAAIDGPWRTTSIYLFSGDQAVLYDIDGGRLSGWPKPWGGIFPIPDAFLEAQK